MPIWPKTSFAKAALFNKYGRGIVHMGLHEGLEIYIAKRAGRRVKKKVVKDINLLPYIERLSKLEKILERETIELVGRDRLPIQFLYSFAFNGTGDDWKEWSYSRINITTTGGPIIVDIDEQLTSGAGQIVKFAISVDGVIDKTTQISAYVQASATYRTFKQMLVINLPPGQYDLSIWLVMEVVANITVRPAFGIQRFVTLNVRGGV